MKKKISMLIAAALCVICAAGCANGTTESTTGTVALGTTTTAASEEVTTTTSETEQSTSGTSTPTSTAEAYEGETSTATGSLRENTRFTYRGVEFAVGDNADDVIPNLGEQSKPSSKLQHCIPGAGEIEYFYFDGITVQVTQFGLICELDISKFENPGSDATTVTGISLASTAEQCKAILGEAENEFDGYLGYADGGYNFTLIFDDEDGSLVSFSASDMDLPM